MMLNIEENRQYRIAFHHLGFRPFFLFAGIYAVLAMFAWWWVYQYQPGLMFGAQLPAISWHAHEMIYGYTLAVIAGFLLTAVRNWTNVMTLHGAPLILLALVWLAARLAPWLPLPNAIIFMAVLDLGFNLLLLITVLLPILKARQKAQAGILLILLLILIGNVLFYLGSLGYLADGMRMSVHGGVYLVILLIMVMGRRVIPFFIEKGVDETVTLRNRIWLDTATPALMVLFIFSAVFTDFAMLAAACALALFLLQILRMYDWHTPGIWRKPLLWSLYIAYGWIALGFALYVLAASLQLNTMLALHAFAYGGIGLMTLSMMSRVVLGHTGRNVFQPPPVLRGVFILLIAGTVFRVLLPLALPGDYTLWIAVSQWLWIAAFAAFVMVYLPMLIKPRVDGRYG